MTFQVILFQTGSWRDLLTRDRLSISISLLALILSFITFWYNYLQKKRETSRGLRKDLTDVIKELIETNILMIKLEQESNGLDNKLIELRRNYNSRRRYLVERAEFFMSKIPNLLRDSDYGP